MVSASNVTEATPSALTGGNAFTVTWNGSGATVATAPPPGGTGGRHHHHHWFFGG
jgi:hypothetical protein